MVALVLPGQAAARDRAPVVLAPTTDWVLDYAEERCSLIRGFGEGRDALRLQIDSYGGLYSLRMMLAGPAVAVSRKPEGAVVVQLTPDDRPRDATPALLGKAGVLDAASFNIAFGPVSRGDRIREILAMDSQTRRQELGLEWAPFVDATKSVTVRFDSGKTLDIRLGKMTAPLTALRDCTINLWSSWGLDFASQENNSRAVKIRDTTVARVLRSYPASMINSGNSAYVPVRVMVDATGKATSCVIQSDAVLPQFRTAVCQGLMSDFEPALDADGKPVASLYQTSVLFRIGQFSQTAGAGLRP
jgi:hypothetical protein